VRSWLEGVEYKNRVTWVYGEMSSSSEAEEESVGGGCKSVVRNKDWSSSLKSSMDLESELDLRTNLSFKLCRLVVMLER